MERERPSYQEGAAPDVYIFCSLALRFLLVGGGRREKGLIRPLLPVAFTRDSHVRDLDS